METRYYQVGGFRPDIRWFEADWQDDKLAEFLAGPESPLRLHSNTNADVKMKTDGQGQGQVSVSVSGLGPIELVLGIKPSGTSHLLIPETPTSSLDRFNTNTGREYGYGYGYGQGYGGQGYGGRRKTLPTRYTTIQDYISISPINFNTIEDLKKKFNLLRPKAKGSKKGKKSLDEEPWDTSQANKAYRYMLGDQSKGGMRGEFEHGRLLYRLLTNQIRNPSEYSIHDTNNDTKFLQEGLRILSFTCNLRSVDNRHYVERQRKPKPLDYGWAETFFPKSKSNTNTKTNTNTKSFLDEVSVVHLIKAEERFLGTGRTKTEFRYGQTKTINITEIETLTRSRFEEFQSTSTSTSTTPTPTRTPTILLVHDEQLARAALTELGIDISNWKFGLGDLLRPNLSKNANANNSSSSASYKTKTEDGRRDYSRGYYSSNPRDPRIRDRNRSKSPPSRRTQSQGSGIKPDPDNSHSYTSRRSSPPPPTPPPSSSSSSTYHHHQQQQGQQQQITPTPIYMIDVRQLYWTMMQNDQDKLLVEVAKKLNVISSDDMKCWCAGNEAMYLLKIWYELIKGSAIDEQRIERTTINGNNDNSKMSKSKSSTPAPESSSYTKAPKMEEDDDEEEDEDDYDPNDIIQVDNSANVVVNMSDDSETDYGSDY